MSIQTFEESFGCKWSKGSHGCLPFYASSRQIGKVWLHGAVGCLWSRFQSDSQPQAKGSRRVPEGFPKGSRRVVAEKLHPHLFFGLRKKWSLQKERERERERERKREGGGQVFQQNMASGCFQQNTASSWVYPPAPPPSSALIGLADGSIGSDPSRLQQRAAGPRSGAVLGQGAGAAGGHARPEPEGDARWG